MTDKVYLDYNATAPLRPEARAAVEAGLDTVGNPSSVHAFGRMARKVVEDGREAVAALVSAKNAEVVFTSGASEANAQALLACGRKRVLVSAVEHASALDAVAAATRIPVDSEGIIDLDALDALLAIDRTPAVVAVMLANNETGVVQPVAKAAAITKRHGALLLCDAVQGAGKIEIDFPSLGADMMSLSAHKIAGPQGVGALIVSERITIDALIRGGGQERRRRGGTENMPGIAGFGAAAEIAASRRDHVRVRGLRDRMEREALARVPGARIFGAGAPRIGSTTCIAVPGRAAAMQVMALDLQGIAVSAGAACSSGKVKASHVLEAMGVGADWSDHAIRVSLGWATSEADIDRFLDAWTVMARQAVAA
ncbi:MAG TPA: cysteine desulfurase family protein [Alphaproteobacteria bacterium]|nr:cysteine desulfurase family protein [Alphaproteobacteria bacterium]